MSLKTDDVKKIAHLARLSVPENELNRYTTQLSNILDFVEQMNQVDTAKIEPLAHPLDLSQRLRPDVISETDHHQEFQKIAPLVEASLYLVPKVIE